MFHAETECHRRWNQLFAINLMFLVRKVEQFRPGAEKAFGIPYHQEARGVERIVEHWDHPLLQSRPHVNENVAATYKIHPGERRVVKNILRSEDAHVPERLADLVSLFGFVEKPA